MTRWIMSFARFWYDFVIGDDWRIAAGVLAVLVAAALAVAAGVPSSAVAVLAGCLFLLVFSVAVSRAA